MPSVRKLCASQAVYDDALIAHPVEQLVSVPAGLHGSHDGRGRIRDGLAFVIGGIGPLVLDDGQLDRTVGIQCGRLAFDAMRSYVFGGRVCDGYGHGGLLCGHAQRSVIGCLQRRTGGKRVRESCGTHNRRYANEEADDEGTHADRTW